MKQGMMRKQNRNYINLKITKERKVEACRQKQNLFEKPMNILQQNFAGLTERLPSN